MSDSLSTDHPVTIKDFAPAKKNDFASPVKGIESKLEEEEVLQADNTTKSVFNKSKFEISLARIILHSLYYPYNLELIQYLVQSNYLSHLILVHVLQNNKFSIS